MVHLCAMLLLVSGAVGLAPRPLLRAAAPTHGRLCMTSARRHAGCAPVHSHVGTQLSCNAQRRACCSPVHSARMCASPPERPADLKDTAATADAGEAEDEAKAKPDVLLFGRLPLKYLVLMLLVFQNSATTMLVRYTRTPRPGQVLYLGTMAVLVSELIKFPTCLCLIARDEGGFGGMVRAGKLPPP